MIVSKRNGNFPNVGDKFTLKESGSTFFVIACDPICRKIVVQKKSKKEGVTLSMEVFLDLFIKFGEYDEKDLV
jgi:hypothetical protein